MTTKLINLDVTPTTQQVLSLIDIHNNIQQLIVALSQQVLNQPDNIPLELWRQYMDERPTSPDHLDQVQDDGLVVSRTNHFTGSVSDGVVVEVISTGNITFYNLETQSNETIRFIDISDQHSQLMVLLDVVNYQQQLASSGKGVDH